MIYKNLVQKISIPADGKTKQKDYLLAGQLPIIDQGKKLIGGYSNDLTKTISCDLPVIVFGDHTKVVKYISFPFGAGADGIKILKPKENIFPKYLYYATQYLTLKMEDKGYARHYQHLEKKYLSVPPLEEQQRIVARIEELFSELDAAVATLERTKEQLSVYRQAVLKEAFSGTISKHWREENVPSLEKMLERIANLKIAHKKKSIYTQTELIDLPQLPPEWKWISIGDISNGVEYGTSKKSEKEGLTAVIRMGNIQNGKIIWDDLVYSNDEEDIVKYQLKKGDVLFNRTNSPELVGKTAIYGGEQPAIFAGYLIRINHVECINSQYLTYYLNGFTAKQYGNKVKTDGVNQSNINGKKLCSYPFPLCTIEEQEYIVSEIESRLSVCDKIEETVTTALHEAEAMRQSILKQAFAGEL